MNSSISTPFIAILMQNVLTQIPVLLLFVVGLIFAIVRWQKHPKVSLYVIAGCALEIAIIMSFAVAYAYLASSASSGSARAQLGYIYSIAGIARGVLSAVAFGLIIAAAFVNRPSALSTDTAGLNS